MILLDKVNKEIESLIKLKEILEKIECYTILNLDCNFEDEQLDKIFIESFEKIKIISKLKGLDFVGNTLIDYTTIYESCIEENVLRVSTLSNEKVIKIKK